MSNLISKLTLEQEKMIDVYFKKYLAKGYSTSATDIEKVKEAIGKYYELHGLKKPKILVCKSPMECQKLISIARIKGINEIVDITSDKIDSMLKKHRIKVQYESTWFGGQYDNYWIGFYSYINEVLGIPLSQDLKDKFEIFKILCDECNFMYLYDDICFVSEKPSKINLDLQGRLHSMTDAAVQYKDGYSMYSVHGVRVPEFLIKEPNKITLKLIEKESNSEIRRAMINIYGPEKYLLDSNYEVLDTDIDQFGQQRRLLRIKTDGEEDIVRVEVKNSSPELDNSYRTYYLPVDPELRPLLKDPDNKSQEMSRQELIQNGYISQNPQEMTCHNGVASTFGLRGEDYGLNGQIRQGDVFIEFKDGSNNLKFRES